MTATNSFRLLFIVTDYFFFNLYKFLAFNKKVVYSKLTTPRVYFKKWQKF